VEGRDVPQLYVNQLVSSSLRWRELGIVVHQEAGGWVGGRLGGWLAGHVGG
jgi:hypothetical protein